MRPRLRYTRYSAYYGNTSRSQGFATKAANEHSHDCMTTNPGRTFVVEPRDRKVILQRIPKMQNSRRYGKKRKEPSGVDVKIPAIYNPLPCVPAAIVGNLTLRRKGLQQQLTKKFFVRTALRKIPGRNVSNSQISRQR